MENTQESAGKEPIETLKGTLNYEIKFYEDNVSIEYDRNINNEIAVNCIMSLLTEQAKESLQEAFKNDKNNKLIADRLNSAGYGLKWLKINFQSLFNIKLRMDEAPKTEVIVTEQQMPTEE